MVFSPKIYSSFLSLYKLNKELIPIEKKNLIVFQINSLLKFNAQYLKSNSVNCQETQQLSQHDINYDIDYLDLFLQLKLLKYILLIDENSNACITQNILTNNTSYICICKKKLSKIKMGKILFKIEYVLRNIK